MTLLFGRVLDPDLRSRVLKPANQKNLWFGIRENCQRKVQITKGICGLHERTGGLWQCYLTRFSIFFGLQLWLTLDHCDIFENCGHELNICHYNYWGFCVKYNIHPTLSSSSNEDQEVQWGWLDVNYLFKVQHKVYCLSNNLYELQTSREIEKFTRFTRWELYST